MGPVGIFARYARYAAEKKRPPGPAKRDNFRPAGCEAILTTI